MTIEELMNSIDCEKKFKPILEMTISQARSYFLGDTAPQSENVAQIQLESFLRIIRAISLPSEDYIRIRDFIVDGVRSIPEF